MCSEEGQCTETPFSKLELVRCGRNNAADSNNEFACSRLLPVNSCERNIQSLRTINPRDKLCLWYDTNAKASQLCSNSPFVQSTTILSPNVNGSTWIMGNINHGAFSSWSQLSKFNARLQHERPSMIRLVFKQEDLIRASTNKSGARLIGYTLTSNGRLARAESSTRQSHSC